LPFAHETAATLDAFNVPYEITIASAHRSPTLVSSYAQDAQKRGLKVLVAIAGYAAHLAGALAAITVLPVIGLPLANSPLSGFDSLLATVMTPSGVPVATVALNGAKNAALLACQILALADPSLRQKLLDYKAELERQVVEKAASIQ
jgi:5-(carboxyamino)imidazole ribonucleotide mutase